MESRSPGGPLFVVNLAEELLGDSEGGDEGESSMDGGSSPCAPGDESSDPFTDSLADGVTAQLASAGPIGVAAAAAIATGRKRKRALAFEINPSVRKRQQTKLLRKMKATMDEYTARVGQQAAVLCCTPGGRAQTVQSFRVFGSQPLESAIRGQRSSIMSELECALAQQAPPKGCTDPLGHELPPLTVDGIPTPIDKMTQAQLRMFIPEMLKYSTGRSKPGWGRAECCPQWWPDDVPWANVRSDVRPEHDKKLVPWTEILRNIVCSCYAFHGREDLIPDYRPAVPPDYPGDLITDFRSDCGGGDGLPGGMILQSVSCPDEILSFVRLDGSGGGGGEGEWGVELITLQDGTQTRIVHNSIESHDPGLRHRLQEVIDHSADPGLAPFIIPSHSTHGVMTASAMYEQEVHASLADFTPVCSSTNQSETVMLNGRTSSGGSLQLLSSSRLNASSNGSMSLAGDGSSVVQLYTVAPSAPHGVGSGAGGAQGRREIQMISSSGQILRLREIRTPGAAELRGDAQNPTEGMFDGAVREGVQEVVLDAVEVSTADV